MSLNDMLYKTVEFGLRNLDHRGRPHDDVEAEDDHGHDHGAEGDHHDDHHDEEDSGIAMSLDGFKMLMAFLMLLCVGGGVIPRLWKRCRDSEAALSYMNCFSAGLFLGMALVHILPEAVHIYDAWAICENHEDPFPLPYVLFYVGYLLILAVDKMVADKFQMKGEDGSIASAAGIAANNDTDRQPVV